MKKALEQVAAFNRMVGAPQGDVTKPDSTVDMALRLKLIAEEFDELLEALWPESASKFRGEKLVTSAVREWLEDRTDHVETVADVSAPNLPAVADALADLCYVIIGAADVWGIPLDAVWEEVNSANMRKANGPKDPVTGKALKPPGWRGPDIEGVLKKHAGK